MDLSAGAGVLGLLGPNGAGKTSLMEIVAGTLEFEAGSVRFGEALALPKDAVGWRRAIGYLPQYFDFPANTTGRELLREFAALMGYSSAGIRPRMEALLERVNLATVADRDCSRYSRGMKQRLAFALALLNDPPLLLLDEPTAGLDPLERGFFRDLLDEVGRERVVILSTHVVEDVARCAQSLAIVDRGRVIFSGGLAEFLNSANNQVWEFEVPEAEIESLVATRRVVVLTSKGNSVHVRLVGSVPGGFVAVAKEPTLEDAYVLALEGRTIAP